MISSGSQPEARAPASLSEGTTAALHIHLFGVVIRSGSRLSRSGLWTFGGDPGERAGTREAFLTISERLNRRYR